MAKSELEIILRLRVIHEFQDTNSSGYEKARRSALPRTEVPYSGILHATRNDKNNPENNITIRKAGIDDCGLINQMAGEVFPATYQEILSPEQLDYMMDWMYSPENIRKQMEEEGHVYFIAYEGDEPCGYVSVQQQEENVFHLQKIYVLPHFQGAHCGSFLFREAVRYIKEVHPEPCLMELNVNRNNKALLFYERMGMRKLREGDFPIGNGYYMNDYIMGLDI